MPLLFASPPHSPSLLSSHLLMPYAHRCHDSPWCHIKDGPQVLYNILYINNIHIYIYTELPGHPSATTPPPLLPPLASLSTHSPLPPSALRNCQGPPHGCRVAFSHCSNSFWPPKKRKLIARTNGLRVRVPACLLVRRNRFEFAANGFRKVHRNLCLFG